MSPASIRSTLLAVALVLTGPLLASCEENDGPLEQLGESADEAVKDTERAVEDAAD